jgi:uncharacterized protein YceK
MEKGAGLRLRAFFVPAMKKNLLRIFLLFVTGVGITGCATILSLSTADEQTKCGSDCDVPRIYSGTAVDVCGLTAYNLALFALLDLPLSFVGDTLMLPYTCAKRGDISVKTPCAQKGSRQ